MCQHMCNTTCKDRACDLWTAYCSKECIVGYEGQYCERKQIDFEPQAIGNVSTVNEGTFITDINCVSICNPVCDIEWKRTSNTVNDSKSERLHLDRAFREKAGVYTCLVYDPRLSKTFNKNFTVNVRYGPDRLHILPQETNLLIKTGEMAPLVQCIADCYPTCNFQWTKHNDTSVLVNDDTLRLGIVTPKHGGVYTCTVANSAEEFPKSNSLSIEIEITENNGLKISNNWLLVIRACSVLAVMIVVAVIFILLKRKRRRVEVEPAVHDTIYSVVERVQTVQERTFGASKNSEGSENELYDEAV